jgi:hypothetical protein
MFATNNPVFRFVRPGGVRDSIPALRLRAFVNLTPHIRPGGGGAHRAAYPECVVDTGCHLSVIPEYIWRHFRQRVMTPLPFDPAMPLSLRSTSFGGGNYPYDLGELTIRLLDQEQRTLDARIVAQLTRDGGAINLPMTLGLRGGVIDGRILRAEPDDTAPFAQSWFLEDP